MPRDNLVGLILTMNRRPGGISLARLQQTSEGKTPHALKIQSIPTENA